MKILYWGCRVDRTGLANESEAIIKTIRPDHIVVINSSSFHKDAPQDIDKYDGFSYSVINGFPTNREIVLTLKQGFTHAFLCESAYSSSFFSYAKMRGIKTFNFCNPEYFEPFFIAAKGNIASARHHPLPTTILLPSTWYEKEMRELLPDHDIRLVRPPIIVSNFAEARRENFARSGRRKFVHSVGRLCSKDRNGTLDLIAALPYSKTDYELHIYSQTELPPEYMTNDRRVTYHFENVVNNADLHKNYDCNLYPRRYGGLSIIANEALCSGLPVIMSNISPNFDLLPPEWLISAQATDKLQTRLLLDVYSVQPEELAAKIDWLANLPDKELKAMKAQAYEIGVDNFGQDVFKREYEKLLAE